MTNLPNDRISNTAVKNTDQPVKEFFDRYYRGRIEYAASEVDAILGFFDKRGFGKVASASIVAVILQQARLDNVTTFKIIDTLEGLTNSQLSVLVAEILNSSRVKTSALGFRSNTSEEKLESRNIIN